MTESKQSAAERRHQRLMLAASILGRDYAMGYGDVLDDDETLSMRARTALAEADRAIAAIDKAIESIGGES